MNRRSVVSLLVTVPLLACLARADIYVLGASYSAYGVDHPPPGHGGELPNGDEIWADGPVWVAAYAAEVGHPVPISSSRKPATGQTPTNFARGGAQIIDTSGDRGGGTTRPKSAGEQWQECKDFLAANGAPAADDIFVISSFGNDLLNQYETGPSSAVDPGFLAKRVNAMKVIIEDAVALGFKTVLISTLPPLERAPANLKGFKPATLAEFKADIDEFNRQLIRMMRELAHTPRLTLLWLDMAGVIASIADSPQSFGFVNNTSAIHDCNTGADPELVMWWDCLHPSAKLHALMAESIGKFPHPASSGSSAIDNASGVPATTRNGISSLVFPLNDKQWFLRPQL